MDFRGTETRNKVSMKGDVWMKCGKNLTREQILENPDRQMHNLIVDVCSELIAEWAFTGVISLISQHVPGILVLAVGTGDIGWDLQNPPVETADETQLFSELTRKTFSNVTYVDNLGAPSVTRTNIVDFMTTFLEAEAVGPIVEMGLFGGNGALLADSGTMINVRNFPVVNKGSTTTLAILWRLTF